MIYSKNKKAIYCQFSYLLLLTYYLITPDVNYLQNSGEVREQEVVENHQKVRAGAFIKHQANLITYYLLIANH